MLRQQPERGDNGSKPATKNILSPYFKGRNKYGNNFIYGDIKNFLNKEDK
jgi:hypothetical protein